jgi:hypothetical protein
MKIHFFALVCCICFSLSCEKEEPAEFLESDCDTSILEHLDMIPSDGIGTGCDQFYLGKYEYQEGFLYALGHHCMDYIPTFLNCDGEVVCNQSEDITCVDTLEGLTYIGIIGISD